MANKWTDDIQVIGVHVSFEQNLLYNKKKQPQSLFIHAKVRHGDKKTEVAMLHDTREYVCHYLFIYDDDIEHIIILLYFIGRLMLL